MKSIEILGCRVDAIERHAAVERIAEFAHGPPGSIVVTLGVEMVMCAQRNADFHAIVARSKLNLCDTIGLLLASRIRGGPLHSRVTGVELVDDLGARSARVGDLRLYLLGGQRDTAKRAAAELQRRHPGAIIAGFRDGYFTDAQSAAVALAVSASGANVICAGLGSPKQELWLARYGAATGCGVGIGIGGSLDVLAGTVERAPRIVQGTGLEWAYRLVREPRRWRRQLALPRFAYAALRETFVRRATAK